MSRFKFKIDGKIVRRTFNHAVLIQYHLVSPDSSEVKLISVEKASGDMPDFSRLMGNTFTSLAALEKIVHGMLVSYTKPTPAPPVLLRGVLEPESNGVLDFLHERSTGTRRVSL